MTHRLLRAWTRGCSLRRPTWKWGLETHLASCRKRGSMIFTNSDGSMTSRISSNSFRNMTSFGLWVFGQYLRSAITTCRRDNIQGSWGHGLLPCSGGPSEQPQMRWCFLPYKKEQ